MAEQDEDRELTAKTVDEAIEIATLEFGVGRDEIEIDVLSAGRQGILGIGAEPAVYAPAGSRPTPQTQGLPSRSSAVC